MNRKFVLVSLDFGVLVLAVFTLRFVLGDLVSENWKFLTAFVPSYLFMSLVTRPFFKRKFPEPKKGWAE